MVGQTLATRLAEPGHEGIGSRTADNKEAEAWRQRTGIRLRVGTFRDAAAFGDSAAKRKFAKSTPAEP